METILAGLQEAATRLGTLGIIIASITLFALFVIERRAIRNVTK